MLRYFGYTLIVPNLKHFESFSNNRVHNFVDINKL